MFADLPPPDAAPPAITVQQQADLECLRLGFFISGLASGQAKDPRGPRLVTIYLRRLERADDTHDWRTLAAPPAAIDYGQFMTSLRTCEPRGGLRRFRP